MWTKNVSGLFCDRKDCDKRMAGDHLFHHPLRIKLEEIGLNSQRRMLRNERGLEVREASPSWREISHFLIFQEWFISFFFLSFFLSFFFFFVGYLWGMFSLRLVFSYIQVIHLTAWIFRKCTVLFSQTSFGRQIYIVGICVYVIYSYTFTCKHRCKALQSHVNSLIIQYELPLALFLCQNWHESAPREATSGKWLVG